MKRSLTGRWELNYLDEAELIARTQNGDTEAFTPIVHRYRERIYKLIYQWVGHHETAEDLCQEVFLKAWQALPKFKSGSVFYTWLYQIAVDCNRDFMRKQIQMARRQSDPEEILETKELSGIISECIRQLPSYQRHIFYLHYRDGLPVKKIASRLNTAEPIIKTHLRHARLKLQHKLRPYVRNESFRETKEI